ncbi:uncharacterized protein (TIGR02117 family) [Oceanisphaera litoralis]|uniref:DUF2459 domain-containing protein n=1 Tax=Oceanisphaera litoralis TaxID=225144 RepID=UPI001956B446|nr:DUF2459 domain-containing protein [Oceanisphaera litoralis]MBM7456964.1 uncharacterized protein (TIGR02117 family) [Oceanisphaera litoralis]
MKFWLLLLLSLLGAGCGGGEWRYLPGSPAEERTLYLVNHGWHTGVVLPAAALEARLTEIGRDFAGARFYEVGWGDQAFYQAEEIDAGLVLRALLWPSASVIHLVALPRSPAHYFRHDEVLAMTVSERGMALLLDRVSASFRRHDDGGLVYAGRGRYGNSAFYRAEGRYHLFNTCNTWVARVLADAGVPMRPVLALTAGGLMRQARTATAYRCHTEC